MPYDSHPKDDKYAHAATARRLAIVMQRAREAPLAWAQEIARLQGVGEMRPRKQIADQRDEAKLRASIKPELAELKLKTIVRGENELRLRSLIRAARLLAASGDKNDKHSAKTLSAFLANEWGIRRACEVVAEGDVDDLSEYREKWGDAQLPPAEAFVGTWVADELLIAAAIRRLK